MGGSKMKERGMAIFQLFLPIVGGTLIGFFLRSFINYSQFILPTCAPSPIVFPIVWSILYLLIGLGYFLYRQKNNQTFVIMLYYIHLIVNFLWSILFFYFQWKLFAIFWIIFLIILVLWLMIYFYFFQKISFYLFLPYLLWLFFATYLNIAIYILN